MIESVDIFPGSALAAGVGCDIAPKRSLLLLELLAATGAEVEAEVKSPNSACKPRRSEEAEDGMVAVAWWGLTAAGTVAVLPIRPRRSAEAEVEAGTLLLGEGAVTGRGGSVLATAGLLVAGAVGLLAGKTTFLATSTFALLRLMADSSPCSNPIGKSGGLEGCQLGWMNFFFSYFCLTKASTAESVCGLRKSSGIPASYTALAFEFCICCMLATCWGVQESRLTDLTLDMCTPKFL